MPEFWAFPQPLQPRQDALHYDLQAALHSVVLVHARIAEAAFTAPILGTERIGHGVVIGADGLVLTIGYLITEASSIWLTAHDGTVIPAHALACDQASGLGLLMPLGKLPAPVMPRGNAAAISVGDAVTIIGHGGIEHALRACVIARREFAGYWEYVLDEALFTAPAHPQWGGAALVSDAGQLLGIGSLLVQEDAAGSALDANMFVPIDLLEPVLEDMVHLGRAGGSARPWLGMYATPLQGSLVVGGLAEGGPAQRAGMRLGDVLLEVGGEPVTDLAQLFRQVWRTGPAGAQIAITVGRGDNTSEVRVTSADRNDFLLKPRHH